MVIQQRHFSFFFHLNLHLLKPDVVVRIRQSSKHNKNECIKRKAGGDPICFFSDYTPLTYTFLMKKM